MIGINNNKLKMFHLKVINKGKYYCVRLKPGFNMIKDDVWKAVETADYVKGLFKDKSISKGTEEIEELELDATEEDNAAVVVRQAPPKKKKGKKKKEEDDDE